ncbi:MAG TPA: hypothetical protein VEC36_05015, partial [Patescibacteria group bacterium]|nr:hypothetical protein [Patescibacteria group bacterium]
MNLLLLLFIFLLYCTPTLAQNQANEWFFGENCWVSFKTGSPVVQSGGALYTYEGATSISDAEGRLLFYTEGTTIWNSQHSVMQNGAGLVGGTSSTQAAIILPHPGNPNQYYIFTSADRTNFLSGSGFHFSIVDIQLNEGLGAVIEKNSILLPSNISEAVTATVDCSGKGYWILTHSEQGNTFYAFHLTRNGLNTKPVVTSLGTPSEFYFQPFLKFSPNSRKLALSNNQDAAPALSIYDFDNTNGTVSAQKVLLNNPKEGCYGVTFSHDNSKLYAGHRGTEVDTYRDSSIVQFNISLPTLEEIRASMFHIKRRGIALAMQMARDGKIYVTQGEYLAAIEKPNL